MKVNILHISASHANKQLHAFSYHFKKACEKLGYNIVSLSPYTDGWITKDIDYRFEKENFKDYYIGKTLFPLSRPLKNYPDTDIIFIENPKFPFGNDVDIPVIYYHRDIHSKVYCPNPTHLAIRFSTSIRTRDGRPNGGQPEILERNWPEIWYDDDIEKLTLAHAISEDEFDEFSKYKHIERSEHGYAYYGSYKSIAEMMAHNTTHYIVYKRHYEIIEFIKKNELALEFREINESLDEYKEHLFKFDATMIIPGWDSWETRRLYEASYCKCVPILYIQNHSAEQIFKDQGYIHNETCITFTTFSELEKINLGDYNLIKIRKNGFKLVTEKHTYEARVLELFEKIDIKQILLINSLNRFIKDNNNTTFNKINRIINNLEEFKNRVFKTSSINKRK